MKTPLEVLDGLIGEYFDPAVLLQILERDSGYVIVPKEPSDGMVTAVFEDDANDKEPDLPCGHDIGGFGARAIWRVMIGAAPKWH